MDLSIRRASIDDATAIANICNYYINETVVSFETEPLTARTMAERIEKALVRHEWLVGIVNSEIIGYSYLWPFKPRAAYHQTAESTVYISPDYQRKGYGRLLYEALIQSAKQRGFRELIGVIALPNPPSIRLHDQVGFNEVGVLNRVGYKFGKFINVAIWQKSMQSELISQTTLL